LSLYVHIPWCVKKCPYCDFNSHEAKKTIPEERYIEALIRDLETELPNIQDRRIESIFIGGGTPSLFSADGFEVLMNGFRERLDIKPDIEITMEANPGTFEQERFTGFRQSGINRLSIGIQSYNNQHLKALGRIHGADEAENSASIAKKAGFENFNLDLMFGLPKQTIDEALDDLMQAIKAKPNHISWYQLTIEENTLFHYAPPPVPADELIWNIQEQGQAMLQKAGYEQYEVSAYAQKDRKSKHNLNYWTFGDYLGIGAGAHGKITMPDGSIARHTKYRHPEEYMSKALNGESRSTEKTLKIEDIIFEFMLNVARLKCGFTKDMFEQRTLLKFNSIQDQIQSLIEDGLFVQDKEVFKPSEKGCLFVNDIVNRFL